MSASLAVVPGTLDDIRAWRDRHRDEMGCQIIHDSIHARPGWTDEYRVLLDETPIGYGSVAVGGPWASAPALYELYLDRRHRRRLAEAFERVIETSGVERVEAQSNDRHLTTLLLTYGGELRSECVLFEDGGATRLSSPGVIVRAAAPEDRPALDAAGLDVDAGWVAVHDGDVVAAGGVLYHYNRPYGDVYVAVAEGHRRRGIGAYLVQELKRVCRASGSVPAARCSTANVASRRTLTRAGFVPCGAMLVGTLAR